jgi:hypothetical protein
MFILRTRSLFATKRSPDGHIARPYRLLNPNPAAVPTPLEALYEPPKSVVTALVLIVMARIAMFALSLTYRIKFVGERARPIGESKRARVPTPSTKPADLRISSTAAPARVVTARCPDNEICRTLLFTKSQTKASVDDTVTCIGKKNSAEMPSELSFMPKVEPASVDTTP